MSLDAKFPCPGVLPVCLGRRHRGDRRWGRAELRDGCQALVLGRMSQIRLRSFKPIQTGMRLDCSPIQAIFQAQEKIEILIFFAFG